MDTKELDMTIKKLLERMVNENHGISTIQKTRSVLNKFYKHCKTKGLTNISIDVIKQFLLIEYNIDFNNHTTNETRSIRPLLILFEFYSTGSYLKSHQRKSKVTIPDDYVDIYAKYNEYINVLNISYKSKERKLWTARKLFNFFVDISINDITQVTCENIYDFVNTLTHIKINTLRTIKTNLRQIFNWLYQENIVSISGNKIYPIIRKNPPTEILSYYTNEEIKKIVDVIDTTTSIGKRDYAIISLLIYYGIRIGDIEHLKFENIDWKNNKVSFIQSKTNNLLILPLINEVKLSLLDYIKNARNQNNHDEEYIFLTTCAPYTKYKTSSMQRKITKYMNDAGIDYSNKHHGPHSLRHSLATNLLNENIPISSISSILGHSNTKTTEIYLTVDEKHLKELSLEVPTYN